MLTHKAQLLSTRRGNVIRLVREHYLREDIDCRLPGASDNPFTTDDCEFVIVPDAETVLNQIDALQHPKFVNIIILQTVYEQVKNKSRSICNRLNRLISAPEKHITVFANEHFIHTYVEQNPEMTTQDNHIINIVKALNFLQTHFPIVFINNFEKDVDLYQKFDKLNCKQMTVHQFAEGDESLESVLTTADVIAANSEPIFEEHLPILEVQKLIKAGKADIGIFSLSQFSRDEGTVRTEKTEIIIQSKKNQNRAIDGDKVAVQILPESEWMHVGDQSFPTGKIIAIVSQPKRTICGTVEQPKNIINDWQTVMVVPMDPALPKIRIRTRQVEQLLGFRVEVAIDGWSAASKYPSGHYISTIGAAGDIHTESEVILLTKQIPHHKFPPAVLECLPPKDFQPTEKEIARRMDLRDRLVCSIDPPGCTDIDDALHYKDLGDGTCEVGVHIADVSYFVREGTAIDLEARERGTTVYLVEKRIHMLPSLLSENLCSLMGGVERLAFSVVAVMDKETAETKSVRFGKSVIRSRAALSYGRAQEMVDDEGDQSDLAKGVRGLLAISRLLKKKRMDAGALTLSSPQLHFVLDSETMEPLKGELYEHHEVNSLVEEFMLYANIEVAKEIYRVFPQSAMLRRHEPPMAARFDFLNRALKRFNIQLNPETNRTLVDTLDAVGIKDKSLDNIVRIMTTRCMQRAKYFSSGTTTYDNFQHYGLATPIYTHFTSPIRRYSDLVVHRQLAAAVGYEKAAAALTEKVAMQLIADNLNFRHRMAQEAGRASAELFMMEMLRKEPGKIEEGKVIKVKATVFVALIERFGVEGHVHVDGAQWIFNEAEEALENGDKRIAIFDKVRVCVNVTEMNMHGRSRLDLTLAED